MSAPLFVCVPSLLYRFCLKRLLACTDIESSLLLFRLRSFCYIIENIDDRGTTAAVVLRITKPLSCHILARRVVL